MSRTVVVGASSGLGRCIGVGLAQRGAQVALLARRRARIEAAAEEAGPGAVAIECDVTDEGSCRSAFDEAADALGGIDNLIYTPAISPLVRMVDTGADTWRRIFDTNVIGAAHGGWRGALGGIVEATLDRMEALGAKRARIRAGIGPCIAQTSYEVGPEFPQQFLAHDPASAAYFAPALRTGHFMFDLPGYIESRLARAGVAAIERATHDTVAEDTRFFSYRRACLRGEPVYGRALSAIALRD